MELFIPKAPEPEEYLCDKCEEPATRVRYDNLARMEAPLIKDSTEIDYDQEEEITLYDQTGHTYLCDDCED